MQAAHTAHEPARHNQPAVQQQPVQSKTMDSGGPATVAVMGLNAPRQMPLDNVSLQIAKSMPSTTLALSTFDLTILQDQSGLML